MIELWLITEIALNKTTLSIKHLKAGCIKYLETLDTSSWSLDFQLPQLE